MEHFLWWAFYEHPLIATFAAILLVLAAYVAIVRSWPVRPRPRKDFAFTVWREFKRTTKEALGSLSRDQRLAYAILVCKRFRPYYDRFASSLWTGNPGALDDAERLFVSALTGEEPSPEEIARVQRRVEDAVPDTDTLERFPYSGENLLAQDAAIAYLSALGVLNRGTEATTDGETRRSDELDHLWWLASSCYEAADREAQDAALPLGGIVTAAVEAEVEGSEAIQRELQWQRSVLADLRAHDGTLARLQELLRRYASEPLIGRMRPN